MKPTLLTVSVLVFVIGAVFTWRARSAERDADLALVSVAQQVTSTTAAIQRAETQRVTLARENDALRAALTQSVAAGKKTPPMASKISLAELEQKIAASRSTASTPASQLLGITARRADVRSAHQEFFAKRGLSPAQIDRFLAISQKSFEANMDVAALVKAGVVAEDDPVVEKLKAETKSEQDAAFRELLGDVGFNELQERGRMTAATEMMNGFAGMAAIYGGALNRAQLDQLVQIVANADSSYRAGGAVNFDGVDWDRVDAEARPLLSDAQWEIFQKMGSGLPFNWAYSRAAHAINKAKLADATRKPVSNVK